MVDKATTLSGIVHKETVLGAQRPIIDHVAHRVEGSKRPPPHRADRPRALLGAVRREEP